MKGIAWNTEAKVLAGLALCITIPMVILAAIGLMHALPTDLRAVSESTPALTDRAGRQAPTEGCGLNQKARGDQCAATKTQATTTDVSFPSSIANKGLETLSGTLWMPKTKGPHPAVVLIGGSGPTDRHATTPGDLLTSLDQPLAPFDQLAKHLSSQGLAVLQYDKRTCAACYKDATGEHLKAFEFSDLIADARDAVGFVAKQPGVNGRAVVVVGHSQGAALAPLVARDNPSVLAVALLAGTTESLGALLANQTQRKGQARAKRFDLWSKWSHQALADAMRACAQKTTQPKHDPNEACMGPGLTLAMLAGYDALQNDANAALPTLNVPIIALQGTLDINVSPQQIDTYKTMLSGRDAEFHRLKGVTHSLTDGLGAGAGATGVDPRVLDLLDTFLGTLRAPKETP